MSESPELHGAQPLPDEVAIDEVMHAESERCRLLRESEYESFAALHGDEFKYTHMTGVVEGKAEYVAHTRDVAMRNGASNDFSRGGDVTVQIYGGGSVAVMNGSLRSNGVGTKRPFRTLLQVWVKREGSWLLVASQSTASEAPTTSS